MIETAAEVLHENQRHTTLLSKLSVGEADSFRLQELCRCCYVRVRHLQLLARKYNPSDISGLVDLGPMPRFKDMNHSIPGLGSHVLGDGDVKIGVGLSPNE